MAKGAKKKIVDPLSKKEPYEEKAPAMFSERNVQKTSVIRTLSTDTMVSDGLKNCASEVSLTGPQNVDVTF